MEDLDDSFLPYTVDISLLSSLQQKDLLEQLQRVGKTLYSRNHFAETR
jgi:hypothetical protein